MEIGKVYILSAPPQGDMLAPKIPMKEGGITGEGRVISGQKSWWEKAKRAK